MLTLQDKKNPGLPTHVEQLARIGDQCLYHLEARQLNCYRIQVNQFLACVSILYSLKIPKILWFSGISRWCKIGTLARNWLKFGLVWLSLAIFTWLINESFVLNLFLIGIAVVRFGIPLLCNHIFVAMSCMKFIQNSEAAILKVLQNSCYERFSKIHRKKPVLESFLERFQHRLFFVKFAKFSRTSFLQNTSKQLILKTNSEDTRRMTLSVSVTT